MINLAIQLLAAQLNQHLRRAYDLNEDRVIVSNLLDMSGVAAPNISNNWWSIWSISKKKRFHPLPRASHILHIHRVATERCSTARHNGSICSS